MFQQKQKKEIKESIIAFHHKRGLQNSYLFLGP